MKMWRISLMFIVSLSFTIASGEATAVVPIPEEFDIVSVTPGTEQIATASGTSNGFAWSISPTFISNLSVLDGSFAGFNTANHNPAVTATDNLHIGGTDFTLTFDQSISAMLIYIGENHGPSFANLDFGITPTVVSGDVLVDGTRFSPTSLAGGTVLIDGINSSTLTHTASVANGLHSAFFVVPELATLDIAIDIRPGSDQNPVNLKSNGVLPVAILGEDEFDVRDINLSSLSLDGASPQTKGNSGKVGTFKDVNGDDLIDLLLLFDLSGLDVPGDVSELVLEGLLDNGTAFAGSDSIRIVGPGDINGDGLVNGVDFGIWQAGYGKANGASLADGDVDGDGEVDGVDFGIWQANYPTNVGGAATIPEPTTLFVMLAAGLGMLRSRRSRG